ncbi:DUF302 domain-containing protein [Lichenifustis flavocetrariae]|uniref:DUF302 domain-containing protein n=1 Tax=Lichenifustis flavocetrariae TaxID=2949735 RepID=UPI0024A6A41A|nr:DUF302 domain-containing protein [Lichenifustis flavocetrariae]
MSDRIREILVPLPFSDTLDRLSAAILKSGMTIFATIDHAAGARQVGLHMPPTTVFIYGSPKGGTPAMLSVPNAALDLPLRVLVRDSGNGETVIAFHPVGTILRTLGVPEESASRLETAQNLLMDGVLS